MQHFVNIKKKVFKKEKLAFPILVSKVLYEDTQVDTIQDFELDAYRKMITTFILSRVESEQEITLYGKRPSFLDWLLRRTPSFKVKVNCREVLNNPPILPETTFLYELLQLDNPNNQ